MIFEIWLFGFGKALKVLELFRKEIVRILLDSRNRTFTSNRIDLNMMCRSFSRHHVYHNVIWTLLF